MELKFPDGISDAQKAEILGAAIKAADALGVKLSFDSVKQTLYERFLEWWYRLWRWVGFN